jgi:hypothetical protein
METSYQRFKRIGMKEIPYSKLPDNYAWITGDGDGKGNYYNFFMPVDRKCTSDKDYAQYGLMCRIK